jgi:hypothetical protein
MTYRFYAGLLLCLVIATPAMAGVPVFNTVGASPTSTSMRMMEYRQLNAPASCPDGHIMTYEWTIVENPTGTAYFDDGTDVPKQTLTAPSSRMDVALPWVVAEATPATPNAANSQYIGQYIIVDVTAKHYNEADGQETATKRIQIQISGVNHPPVPAISGNLGTTTDRVPSGDAVVCSSGNSYDPDPSDSFKAVWGLGRKMGGGSYKSSIVMFGSEGTAMSFTVPDMTATIDQEVVLALLDGMHRVEGTAWAYLKPATVAPPVGNTAPTVTAGSPITRTTTEPVILEGYVQDAQGDDCTINWVFLQTGATVQGTSIEAQNATSPAKKWKATANLGTAAAGTYYFRLSAREKYTTSHLTGAADVTVIVGGGASLPPGEVTETPEGCTSGYPTVTISPNPKQAALAYKGGQQVTIVVSAQDSTQATGAFGTTTGAVITWDLGQLGVSGVSAPPNIVGTDKTKSTSTLAFTAPDVDAQGVIKVRAVDAADCAINITFGIIFQKNSTSNGTPTAKIKYKLGSGAMTLATGAAVPVDGSITTINLDGGASTDDGGVGNLSYLWTLVPNVTTGSVNISNYTTQTPTLTVASGTSGSATVTLKVTDLQGANNSASVTFNITGISGSPPVAKIRYKTGTAYIAAPTSPVPMECPPTGASKITIDGATSEDDGGLNNLSFHWALDVEALKRGGVTLSSATSKTPFLTVETSTIGTVTATLTVTDSDALSNSASITFVISDPSAKPTVTVAVKEGDAVVTSPVEEGTTITLDGSASTNVDGAKTNLSFEWQQLSGTGVTLSSSSSAITTFVAPAVVNDSTDLKFQLVVTDLEYEITAQQDVTVRVAAPAIYFAHIGVGPLPGEGELRTVLFLVNNSMEAATGTSVEFFNSSGQSFVPLINGTPWANEPFEIPSQSSRRLIFTAANENEIQIGWVRVKSGGKLTGLALFQIVNPISGEVLKEVSVFASARGKRFATYFNLAEETAVAVANPTEQDSAVNLKLIDYPDGQQWMVANKPLFTELPQGKLGPMQHRAKFVDEKYLGELPPGFQEGTLVIETDNEIIVTVLKTKGLLIFSSLPLAVSK